MGITLIHLEIELKKIYILGTDLKYLLNMGKNVDEKALILDIMLKEMLDVLKNVDEIKYPKKGILFFLPQAENADKV